MRTDDRFGVRLPRALGGLVALAALFLLGCDGDAGAAGGTDGGHVAGDDGRVAMADGGDVDGGGPVEDGGVVVDAGADPGPLPYECAGMAPTQVIGNWDVVPHQRIDGPFEVGVVAFHEEGLDVVFRAGGEMLARVTHPTRNPRTGVWEYWATFDPAGFVDGPVDIEATLVPDCPGHLERELAPLPLLANAGGSLTNETPVHVDCASGDDDAGDGTAGSPFATIDRGLDAAGDGGTVLLAPGACYTLTNDHRGRTPTQWATIRPVGDAGPDDVIITASSETSSGRFGEDLVRFRDVSIVEDAAPGHSTIFYLEAGHRLWLDGVDLSDAKGRTSGGQLTGGNAGYRVYLTDCFIHDIQNAGFGFGRGNRLQNIGSDIFRASSNLTAIDTIIDTIDRADTAAHPDFFQLYAPGGHVENIVIYGTEVLNMGAQGIFGSEGELEDVAFVNLVMEKDPASSALTSQVGGHWDHVLLWHVTTVDSGFLVRGDATELTHFVVQNSIFHQMSGQAVLPDSWTVRNNLFRGLSWDMDEPYGDPVLLGDPMFRDESTDDYRLQDGSPAAHAGIAIPGVPVDIRGRPWDRETPALGAHAMD